MIFDRLVNSVCVVIAAFFNAVTAIATAVLGDYATLSTDITGPIASVAGTVGYFLALPGTQVRDTSVACLSLLLAVALVVRPLMVAKGWLIKPTSLGPPQEVGLGDIEHSRHLRRI